MLSFRDLLQELVVERPQIIGVLLVTGPLSTTTSSSIHWAPAFCRSVCRLRYEVTLRLRATPASIRSQGPWQIAATGLCCSKRLRAKAWASCRQLPYSNNIIQGENNKQAGYLSLSINPLRAASNKGGSTGREGGDTICCRGRRLGIILQGKR